MKSASTAILLTATALALATLALAQEPKKRASPHETTTATIAAHKITIEYGRPYKKGREIMGGLVPFGQVWRTGADEATTLTTTADLMVGRIHVPAGTYSLFTIPETSGWTLILNKTAKQWGAFKYEDTQDLGRTPMKIRSLDTPVEQFTIAIEPTGGGNGVIKLTWDDTEASVDIMAH
jgi:hypothetical protein